MFHHTQIADFGMARDVSDNNYYVTTGGKIPLKWTSPEVAKLIIIDIVFLLSSSMCYRQYFTRNTQLRVMCGVLDV